MEGRRIFAGKLFISFAVISYVSSSCSVNVKYAAGVTCMKSHTEQWIPSCKSCSALLLISSVCSHVAACQWCVSSNDHSSAYVCPVAGISSDFAALHLVQVYSFIPVSSHEAQELLSRRRNCAPMPLRNHLRSYPHIRTYTWYSPTRYK